MGYFDTSHFQLGKELSQLYYSFSIWVVLTTLVKSVITEVSVKKEWKLGLFVFTLSIMALDFGQFLETVLSLRAFPLMCSLKTCCFLFLLFFQTLRNVSIGVEGC